MTPEQVQLIRLTFVQVMNRQEAGRLFRAAVPSRPTPDAVPTDIMQAQKLMERGLAIEPA